MNPCQCGFTCPRAFPIQESPKLCTAAGQWRDDDTVLIPTIDAVVCPLVEKGSLLETFLRSMKEVEE